jgi:hypothetical protein
LPAGGAFHSGNTFRKNRYLPFALLRAHILIQKITLSHAWLCQHGSGGAFGGDGMMNPRRFATGATAYGTVVLAGWVIAWLAGFGSAGIENTGAVPIEDRRAASLAADLEFANAPQTIAMSNAPVVKVDVAKADVATAVESVTGTASDTTAVSDEPESIIWAPLPNSPQVLPPQSPPVQMATASTPERRQGGY